MTIRTAAPTIAAILLVAMGLSAAPAAPTAGPDYGFTGTFGSENSTTVNPEPLSGPTGVAVNQANEDVYVSDTANNRVEWFNASGTYEGQFNGTEIDGAPAGAGSEAPATFLHRKASLSITKLVQPIQGRCVCG